MTAFGNDFDTLCISIYFDPEPTRMTDQIGRHGADRNIARRIAPPDRSIYCQISELDDLGPS
jgi:hypothetical protein